MCRDIRWLALLGSIFSLIQSVVWIGLAAAGALVYLCILPVEPYEDVYDFYRVTVVKLYFEGPNCIPDGSYLGDLNTDYKNGLLLITPEIVFAAMIAYVLLNLLHFICSTMLILSIVHSRSTLSVSGVKRLRDVTIVWSLLAIGLCAVDALLTAGFVIDIFKLRKYLDQEGNSTSVGEKIPIVPLSLALISSRFIVFWIWNLVVGLILFFGALCNKQAMGIPTKREKERMAPMEKEQGRQPKILEKPSPVTPDRSAPYKAFDLISNPDFIDVKRSMEAVTRFNDPVERKSQHSGTSQRSRYSPRESLWQPSKSNVSDKWEKDNEAFVIDEEASIAAETSQDFDHDLKNFEQGQQAGQQKIKVVKPPIGKPVSIPVPPPLPVDEVGV